MAEEFADHHLNIPRLSILGTDNSDLFHPQAANKSDQAQLPKELSKHPGFARVFKPGKLTFGLIAPFKGYPDTPIPDVYDLGESARLAEKAGFAALWIRDVPFYDPRFGDVGQGLDPFVTLGYLAAKAKKIALGSAGIIAQLREPIHIAKAAASANVLTNNRFILGLSSGDQPVEYPAFKKDFADRAERFREAWEMIRTLTDQDKRFAKFAGHHYGKLDGSIDMVPKMPGLDRLPMVAIGRDRQNFGWLANTADAWIWHGVRPQDTGKIVRVISERNEDHLWHPFGYANFVELLDDPNAPAQLYNNIYLRGGSKALAEYWESQRQLGLSHVTINFKPTRRPFNEVVQDFSENVLPKFAD